MYKAKIAVYSEIPTKRSTQSEHRVEFLNVKNLVVRRETAKLWKVNRVGNVCDSDTTSYCIFTYLIITDRH
jgi:hypothetical protein